MSINLPEGKNIGQSLQNYVLTFFEKAGRIKNQNTQWRVILTGSILVFYQAGLAKKIRINALKETLVRENDRKTASPTESAVSGNWRREHSGAGCLSRGGSRKMFRGC